MRELTQNAIEAILKTPHQRGEIVWDVDWYSHERDPATFAISKRVYLAVDNDRDRAEHRLREWFGVRYRNADMASRVCIWGSRDECLDKLGALVKAGAQHLMLNPVFDEMEHLELLAEEVVPHV